MKDKLVGLTDSVSVMAVQVVFTEHTCVSYGLWITGVSPITECSISYCCYPDSEGGVGSRHVQLLCVRSCV